MKNRKLFPDLPAPNQTTDCSGICDPACPYNCYPYPDYYYLSPPPPPPRLSDHNHYISPYVIILASVLASLFLLIGYYVIVVKSCYGWCWSRNNRQAQAQTDGSDDEFLDENRVDHPIWFITTVGLQQSIINSITICKYKKGEGLIEGTECSVCLNEFQEEETVRLLPKCNHAFHISCIDTWLRAHTNCPLCRAHIVFDPVRAPPTSADQNPNSMELADESRIENAEFEGELSGQNQGRSSEVCENRAITDSGNELVEAIEQRISKDRIHSDENGVTKEMQLIKRCVSMDSSTAARFLFGFANLYPPRSEGSSFGRQENVENSHSSIIQKQEEGNSSIDQHLHPSPVPMKRSFSCSGRFFSSKRSRSMNSILPLIQSAAASLNLGFAVFCWPRDACSERNFKEQ